MGKRNPLDPFALNVGRLCNEWQHLELTVEVIFARVAGMGTGPLTNMLRCVDLRQLIAGIKIGLAATSTSDLQTWSDEVIVAVDYIDNVLRPRRNRYVHDSLWMSAVFGPLRQQRQLKPVRPTVGKAGSLQKQTRIEDLADLRETVRSVRQMVEWLWQLDHWRERRDKYPNALLTQIAALRPPLLPQGQTGRPLPDDMDSFRWAESPDPTPS